MINTGKPFIDFIGGRGDISYPKVCQPYGVLLYIDLSTCFIREKVDTSGDLSLGIFRPYLPDQAVLTGDVSGQISVGSLRISAEGASGGEFKNQKCCHSPEGTWELPWESPFSTQQPAACHRSVSHPSYPCPHD